MAWPQERPAPSRVWPTGWEDHQHRTPSEDSSVFHLQWRAESLQAQRTGPDVSSALPSFLSAAAQGNLEPFSLPCSLSPQPALSESRQETKVCLHCPSEAKPHKLASPPGFDVILKFSVPFRNRRRKPKSSYQVQRVKPVSSPPRGKSLTQNLRPDVGSFLLWFLAKFSPQKGSS